MAEAKIYNFSTTSVKLKDVAGSVLCDITGGNHHIVETLRSVELKSVKVFGFDNSTVILDGHRFILITENMVRSEVSIPCKDISGELKTVTIGNDDIYKVLYIINHATYIEHLIKVVEETAHYQDSILIANGWVQAKGFCKH